MTCQYLFRIVQDSYRSLPDNTICALSYYILNIVLLRDIEGDFSRASARAGRARHVGDLRDV